MATRAARVAPGHVEALNMIDIVFYGGKQKEKRILESWKIYQDHLNHLGENPTTEQLNAWSRKGDDLFTDLLYSMAQALNYDFDKVHIKRGIYFPKAHGDNEIAQLMIRDSLLKILSGTQPLPMKVVSLPVSDNDIQKQKHVQDCLLEYLEGKRAIKVRLEEAKVDGSR